MQIGYIGLGKMGKNMVLRLLEKGIEVVAWNRSPEPLDEVKNAGAKKAATIEELVNLLPTPRIIWLMLPAGEVTDEFIDTLIPLLSKDDLVIDGANSFYKDTLKRGNKLSKKGIHFMDIGVSGGPSGARNGACLMIGGEEKDFQKIEDIIISASDKSAYALLGPLGAGHFAKMVHNGIEYGMMQAIAEGADVLKKSVFNYELNKVFDIYNKKSVIESRLVEWAKQAFKDDENLTDVTSKINATGEGEWTINTAKELGVAVPVIEESFNVRKDSTEESENFRDKVVSALRGKFGGHAVNKS